MLFIFIFGVAIVCGVVGASMAKSRGKDSALWFLICAFFPIIGILALAVSGEDPPTRSSQGLTQASASPVQTVRSETKITAVDTAAWKALREYDADIASAVAAIGVYGRDAEERLATAYLAVSDKNLLPAIISKISQDFEGAAREKIVEEERRRAAMNDRELQMALERERRSKYTIDQIEANGMVYAGRKVKSAALYAGDRQDLQGWAEILYEDGSTEMRSGGSVIFKA